MYGYQKFMAFLQTERDKKTIGNCNTTSNTLLDLYRKGRKNSK
jgi:hypothetical protein